MALSVVGAVAALAAPCAAFASGPSQTQIRKAVRAAERSKRLWATINICKTHDRHGRLGVRAEMPSLGFKADMQMTFEVTYRPAAGKAYKPIAATRTTVLAGDVSNKVLQDGRTYPFQPSSTVMAGTVTFTWSRDGRRLGRTTRKTTGGRRHVDFADPPGFSRATCKLS